MPQEPLAPLVSVCMITYNHAPFILRAIESILAQNTDFPFELVIGEDYSTDGTREIVLNLAAQHPDKIRLSATNRNVGSAANIVNTEALCTGDFIAFCEGDDFWHDPLKIQKQVNLFRREPSLGLVFSDYNRFYPTTNRLHTSYQKSTDNIPPTNLSPIQIVRGGRSLYILTCTVMARRTLVQNIINSDPSFHRNPNNPIRDTQIWAEIASQAQIAYIAEPLATYTVNEISASKSKSIKAKQRFSKHVYEISLHLAKKLNFPKEDQTKYRNLHAQAEYRLAILELQTDIAMVKWRGIKTATKTDQLMHFLVKRNSTRLAAQIYTTIRSFRNLLGI